MNKFKNTPLLPESIYQNLPDFLQKCTSHFKGRKRDMLLLSSLSVMSGMLHNYKGLYDGKEVYPNLFLFVIASAASGKSVITYSKSLADDFSKTFEKQNDDTSAIIPANSSSAALHEILTSNNGIGIICETEADTMANMFKNNDWGNYSEILRKAFHQETISFKRKGQPIFKIESPKISVILSGTPNQLTNLFTSKEDGLLSRFVFYAFEEKLVWNRNLKDNFDSHFVKYSQELNNVIENFNSNQINFKFTENQEILFDKFFTKKVDELYSQYQNKINSLITRAGLITYKIAMILTFYRKIGSHTHELVCQKEDFDLAQKIIECVIEHAIDIIEAIPEKENKHSTPSRQKFFDTLPAEEFTRSAAIGFAKKIALKDSFVDKTLKLWTEEEKIEKLKNGIYKKK